MFQENKTFTIIPLDNFLTSSQTKQQFLSGGWHDRCFSLALSAANYQEQKANRDSNKEIRKRKNWVLESSFLSSSHGKFVGPKIMLTELQH